MPMDHCCKPQALAPEAIATCPQCHERGVSVEVRAVKALLTETALAHFECVSHRFCKTPTCPVVYFDEAGRCYPREQVRVRVWHKEAYGDRPICYCFGETESTLREELKIGASEAVSRVRAHMDAARCACDVRNPRGVCCLGDLTAAVQRVKNELVCVGNMP